MDTNATAPKTQPVPSSADDGQSTLTPATYRTILVPVSAKTLGTRSGTSLRHAMAHSPARIVLLHVNEPVPTLIGGDSHRQLLEERTREATALLSKLQAAAEASGVCVSTRIESGSVAEGIIQAAHEEGVNLIVMFTDGRDNLQDMLLGTITEQVLRGTDIPLLAVRSTPPVRD